MGQVRLPIRYVDGERAAGGRVRAPGAGVGCMFWEDGGGVFGRVGLGCEGVSFSSFVDWETGV